MPSTLFGVSVSIQVREFCGNRHIDLGGDRIVFPMAYDYDLASRSLGPTGVAAGNSTSSASSAVGDGEGDDEDSSSCAVVTITVERRPFRSVWDQLVSEAGTMQFNFTSAPKRKPSHLSTPSHKWSDVRGRKKHLD